MPPSAWLPDLGAWLSDLGAWLLDLGAWLPDLGAWLPGLGAWLPDLGAWLPGTSVRGCLVFSSKSKLYAAEHPEQGKYLWTRPIF